MKARTFLAAISLALGASMAIADSVSSIDVQGARENQHMTRDQRGVQSCARLFVADILPNRQTSVKLIDRKPTRILDSQRFYVPRPVMQVAMNATDPADGTLLAKGSCTVNNHASVIDLKMTKFNHERLASMTGNDLRLVASVR